MIRSVRARLTLAVTLVVGGLALGAALAAPHIVREALVGDRLDAEAARDEAVLAPNFELVVIETGRPLGPAELTTLFGPQIAALTDSLHESGALAELQSFDAEDRVFVSPVGGVVGTVQADGTVRVDELSERDLPGPIVTTQRLEQLAAALAREPEQFPPFELFDDDQLTFDEFIADLDRQFGTDIGDRLDENVFDEFPAFDLGDARIPRSVFEMLQDEIMPSVDPPAVPVATSIDEYAFGTRPVVGHDVIVTASIEGIDGSVDRVRDALWLSVPLAMLLAGGVTWLLAGRALRPVRAITEQTRRIRSSTLHERVPVPEPDDEVRALATEMNTMLARVQREDERRRQFVADASHELRSPIAAIRSQAEASLATASAADAELATGVLAEAERMGILVDDLLSLARHDEELAAPGVELDLDDIVLEEAQRPRRLAVDVRGVSAGRVRGRADELRRVVIHLLDNAARHADEHIAVSLDAERPADGGEWIVLRVDDDGPGVPPHERERIFERFVRLDEARHRDGGGAGLGLAVVASVARASGGSVDVDDSPLGGARFEVRLPAAS